MKGPAKIAGTMARGRGRTRQLLAVAALAALGGGAGCHHKRVQPLLLPPHTSVALVDVPKPGAAPPLVEPQATKLPAVPTAEAVAKPKRVKKRAPKPAPAAQQAATASPAAPKKAAETATAAPVTPKKVPDAAAVTPGAPPTEPVADLGALTVGGEQSPRALQQANELLASNERRLNALTAEAQKAQADLVAKVRNFQKEAQQALSTGDAEGAQTLATKGKLLLDDVDKVGSP